MIAGLIVAKICGTALAFFRVLFHSMSQVIYFHYPAHQLQIQVPLYELHCHGAGSIILQSLLLQIRPEIPVPYEQPIRCLNLFL